ncbi:Peptidase family S41 [Duganella sp. CF402]|uniref:S41 family peptidase n=1 Tax=unclassified Duganella TaxID=2636909 RepID=UPI0008CB91DC|nr:MULTISPECIES: S41 family peptidase [unclassified Duganella]RZT05896.1 peptidase S41-like protein [Duganella sp. BK701]SEM80574.1 Peptidase family S41 [Duganella sp. CF402]
MKFHFLLSGAAVTAALLAGCGGSSGTTPATPTTPTEPTAPTTPTDPTTPTTPTDPTTPSLPEWHTLLNHCAAPRGTGYPDVQGTLNEEMRWLHSFFDATYLWYREIPANLNMADYSTAIDYFAQLKTSAVTASGRPKDRFHFTYPTATWEALNSSGVALGYGLTWLRNNDAALSRIYTIGMVEPGSPAALAGMQRGDSLVSADGAAVSDTSSEAKATISAALAPKAEGESHLLSWSRNGTVMQATLAARKLAIPPVRLAKVLDTADGKVGYLNFGEHNAVAEGQLVNAIQSFKDAGVKDLVLDLRYNGGGLLSIASELAYMIAGPEATVGRIFEKPIYNDKTTPQAAIMFQAAALGYKSDNTIKAGTALPYLNLKRVTVLTAAGTCSASESVINSLRGVDVEVNLIGGETCGKPYAFTPAANCGTTYFAIQLQGVNNKGFGDYADGFTPTCRVADDLSHAQGDPAEGVLAAALSYRSTGACPVTTKALRSAAPAGPLTPLRHEVMEISIRDR